MIHTKKNLNETLIGNCNMEVPEGNAETKGTVPGVYADAINQRRQRTDKIEQDFKEQDKFMDEFAKESQKTENNPKGTPQMKKMHLDESLFEEIENPKLYKSAERIANDIEQFLSDISNIENINDYLDDYDLKDIGKAMDALRDFAQAYSYTTDNEDIFEAVAEPPVKPTVDTTLYYKNKRGSLVDIIEDELGRGEVVYKQGITGKYNPTHAPSLNIDQYLIGGGEDEKGEYISAWLPEDKVDDAIAIAKKYGKEYKVGKDKYVKGDNNFIHIYIDESDWEGNYVDPNVPILNRRGK